jgi:SAM-dependent methyltransferase
MNFWPAAWLAAQRSILLAGADADADAAGADAAGADADARATGDVRLGAEAGCAERAIADLAELATAAPHPAPTDGYAAVLSVVHLARLDDPVDALVRARRALCPGGRLLLLEPNRRTGWRGIAADLATPLLRLATGLRADLPVPALVREAGFTITSVERTTMPTPVAPLRSFVRLVAVPTPHELASPPAAVAGDADRVTPSVPGGRR